MGIAFTNFILNPDDGGSGYGMGAAALLVTDIGGNASFENIGVYNSSLYSLNSVVLSQKVNGTVSAKDITVRNSTFLGFPRPKNFMFGGPENGMLFGWSVNLPSDSIQNIQLHTSVFNAAEDFDYYRKLGYTIQDCASSDGSTQDESAP